MKPVEEADSSDFAARLADGAETTDVETEGSKVTEDKEPAIGAQVQHDCALQHKVKDDKGGSDSSEPEIHENAGDRNAQAQTDEGSACCTHGLEQVECEWQDSEMESSAEDSSSEGSESEDDVAGSHFDNFAALCFLAGVVSFISYHVSDQFISFLYEWLHAQYAQNPNLN